MVDKVLKFLTVLVSLLFLANAVRWHVDPAGAAEGLGMPLLEGMGRSTQIGDFSAFFLVGGIFGLLGALRGNPMLLYTPAALVGAAALLRLLATAQGAPLAAGFIGAEVVMCVIFLATALRLPRAVT